MEQEHQRLFVKQLLNDIHVLELMLQQGLFESDLRRIGAEQELVIIDKGCRPAPLAMEILNQTADSHFTNELALFNLEFNLDPIVYGGDCLSALEQQIHRLLEKARTIANSFEAEILMIGILPTLRKSDLDLHNITPKPRYYELNDTIMKMRGGEYEFLIKGTDELFISHDSVLLESCNTSFQVHFQVSPAEFPRLYNIAQAVTAPVLAAAANSPLLFGKRLWQETRIVVFQQSIDTRTTHTYPREMMPRVSFGNHWVRDSALEIFQEDIARLRVIVGTVVDENAFEVFSQGRIPSLRALQLFNSTVYRWNRPCYGVVNGKPHLRIENRVLPAGPTAADEIANAAFWLGLIGGMALELEDITTAMSFDDAKTNFLAAAQHGLQAQFTWLGGETIPVQRLISERLLPIAEKGLRDNGIAEKDIETYLGIIAARVQKGQSGARWLVESFNRVRPHTTAEECLKTLTAAQRQHQLSGQPVHLWPLAPPPQQRESNSTYRTVEQVMSTDFFTVGPEEPVELVANLMVWRRVRHLPVEDQEHKLVGLVSYRALLRLLQHNGLHSSGEPIPVKAIMTPEPITVQPNTPTLQAMDLMRTRGAGCLPVVRNGRLVGLVTEKELVTISAELLEGKLKE